MMALPRGERKLCAVLMLDVVGYSRLMEADEGNTHRRLMRLRSEVLNPTVARYEGKIIKETGDGFLATFDSAISATDCGITLQQNIGRIEENIPSAKQILCRIGINVCEVIIEPHDIFGDGVNVAARLQSYAEPSCIVLSQTVVDVMRDHLRFPLVDLGPLHLKNIGRPVRAYSLRLLPEVTHPYLRKPGDDTRPSIAVLPFRFQEEADRYFAEGIVDDIIRVLSGLKELFVISRASTLNINGHTDIRRAARQIAARYVLSGNVHRDRRRLRISTELSDTETGAVLWAERHDGDVTEIFELQDRVSVRVVATIAPHVREHELTRAMRKHPESMDAYDLVLQGLDCLYRMDYTPFSRARGLLQQAIVQDPSYAPAHAYAAQWHIHRVAQGWSQNPDADGREAARLAGTAIDLDRYDALALALHGHARSFLLKEYDVGKSFLDRSLEAGPSCALAWTLSSCTCTYLGDTKTAIEHAERGLQLSPLDPLIFFYLHNLGMAHYANESYEQAVVFGHKAAAQKKTFRANLRVLTASLVALDRISEARETAEKLMEAQPDFRLAGYALLCPFKDVGIRGLFLKRLRMAGLPD